MMLVDIGNGIFVNIDFTLSLFKNDDGYFLNMRDSSRSRYKISKKAYDTILSYGKAKV